MHFWEKTEGLDATDLKNMPGKDYRLLKGG